jgi:aminoglycoside phosphotransferase (APT) family kinase protein
MLLASTETSTMPTTIGLADGLRRLAALPDWLRAALQPERVCEALTRAAPEFASGELRIRDCDPDRLRLRDQGWDAMYKLTVDGPGQQRDNKVVVVGTLTPPGMPRPSQNPDGGAFGSAEWHIYLPELGLDLRTYHSDTALAALPILTDPQQARELLETSIRSSAPHYSDMQIQSCTSKILRYKPGSRCTLIYHLEYGPGAGERYPATVIAKTYSGNKGLNAYQGMQALWDSPLAKGDVVTIAEPLGYIADLKVLVQGLVPEEQTLKDLLRSALRAGTPEALEELHHFTRLTAAGLAALHQSGVYPRKTITWAGEFPDVLEEFGELSAVVPALAEAAEPLLRRLEELNTQYSADPPTPTHRSFRPPQVLIHQGTIGFIDFDGFCQAEPALDIALFLATVKDIGLSTSLSNDKSEVEFLSRETQLARLEHLDTVCDIFLAHYQTLAPVTGQRVMLWETLNILSFVLHGWTKAKPYRLNNAMLMLEQHLRRMGWW